MRPENVRTEEEQNMQTLEAIRKRKSYRGTFRPDPVPRKDLKEIMEAGFLAPSGCNMQTTRFIGVDDPELAAQLGKIYGNAWAETAPAAILLLTRYTASPSGPSYHIQDYSAAAENMLLAIADKGYATTWIEGQIRGEKGERMKKLLGVPEEYEAAVYLPIGVPAAEGPDARKMTFEERAWFNGFGKEEA